MFSIFQDNPDGGTYLKDGHDNFREWADKDDAIAYANDLQQRCDADVTGIYPYEYPEVLFHQVYDRSCFPAELVHEVRFKRRKQCSLPL